MKKWIAVRVIAWFVVMAACSGWAKAHVATLGRIDPASSEAIWGYAALLGFIWCLIGLVRIRTGLIGSIAYLLRRPRPMKRVRRLGTSCPQCRAADIQEAMRDLPQAKATPEEQPAPTAQATG